jgi:RND family efflux transporter MFP subunit
LEVDLRPSFSSAARLIARVVPVVVGIVVLALTIAWMSGAFHAKIPPAAVRPEQSREGAARLTAEVEILRTTETVDAVGTVEPRRKTAVASQLLATIGEIAVNASDRVEKGQLLVTLDDRELQAQLREAEAAVGAAEADVTLRERDFARHKQMYADKAITKEEYDRVEGAHKVSQAQLRRANEQVNRVQVLLSYARIQAPADGIVANRFADPGDLAAPGKPLLAIHDPKELELHASVRESLAAAVRLDMKLRVHIDALSLDLDGTVREIVPQAQEASRSVLIKVALPTENTASLYIGMFGRVSIPVGSIDRVVVPADAVQYIGQLETVEVVHAERPPERRFVRTGRRFGDKVEILSGLTVGENVASGRN